MTDARGPEAGRADRADLSAMIKRTGQRPLVVPELDELVDPDAASQSHAVAPRSRRSGETRKGSAMTKSTPQRGNNGKSQASARAGSTLNGSRMLELVARGLTIRAAASQLKISAKHGGDLYRRELAAAGEANRDLRQAMLAQELETLRLIQQAHMPATLNGDTQAAKVVLAVLDRRAKYLGLDEALRVEVSNANINDAVRDIVELLESDDDAPLILDAEPGAA